jgi:hypothetical protein
MDEVEEHIWEGAKSEGKEDNEERGDTSSPAGAVMEDRVQEMQIDIAAAARTQRRGHASFLAGQMRQVSKMLVAKGHDEYFEPEVMSQRVCNKLVELTLSLHACKSPSRCSPRV